MHKRVIIDNDLNVTFLMKENSDQSPPSPQNYNLEIMVSGRAKFLAISVICGVDSLDLEKMAEALKDLANEIKNVNYRHKIFFMGE